MCDACENLAMDRRSLLVRCAATVLAAATVAPTLTSSVAQAQTAPSSAASTPDEALKLLVEGNARYVANQPQHRDFSAERAGRALGQAPFASILGCADSRVGPELAFDRNPGDLFVVRVAGNFVTPEGLGSLEFGSAVLGSKLIVVLGHNSCGAVNATVEALQKGNSLPGHIAGLVTAMKPGIEETVKTPGANLEQRAVVANVKYNVDRLEKATPIISDLIMKNKLRIVGAVYDLSTGKIDFI